MRTFTRKGYGRIYCANAEDVSRVESITKEMDEFEYEYLPKGMVAPFSEYPKVIYTHKFDALDLDALTAICWMRGIMVWALDAGHEEFVESTNVIKNVTGAT